jgi:hypothetical protein
MNCQPIAVLMARDITRRRLSEPAHKPRPRPAAR